ncbi:MAG: CBS domain-containing protein, partial [Anaerolineales bacterium]
AEAAGRMVQEDISCLVVLDDDGFLTGLISRTDILGAYQVDQTWQSEKVNHYMSKEVVTISPQDHLDRAAHLLLENQIHRVVIAEAENGKLRPLGVLSDADLLYHMVRFTDQ